LEMLGSDSFVTAPAGLCVYSDAANSDCVSGDAACSVFVAAGTPFPLKVKGVCWQAAGETNAQFCDNATTANFRMDNIALTHTLVAPATGVSGNLAVFLANITAAGEAVVQQTVSEVGVFTFTADPPNDYLGAGDVFAGATFTSANIGRFIPHHFDVSIFPNPPGFADNCVGAVSAFTYLGQPFNWAVVPSLTIQARNVAGAVTRNYEGGFWKLTNPLASYTYVDANVPVAASPLTPATSSQTLPDISNCNGTVTIPLIETNFNYTRPDMTVPVTPFVPDVSLSVTQSRLTDTDNVCYDLGAGAGCQGFAISGITGTHMRHGQIQVLNNFGPETADITNSPFEVRYYDGASWVVNADDNCTTGLSFCPSGRISAILPVPLASGKGTFTVSRPVSVQVCLIAPPWLTALTDCTAPDSSCGEFTFGIYRGNDRIINWQEIMR
jgi:MSHA biogenesis protein MshQ